MLQECGAVELQKASTYIEYLYIRIAADFQQKQKHDFELMLAGFTVVIIQKRHGSSIHLHLERMIRYLNETNATTALRTPDER